MEVLTPQTLGEALRLMAERPDAVPVQGGTDVMVGSTSTACGPIHSKQVDESDSLIARESRRPEQPTTTWQNPRAVIPSPSGDLGSGVRVVSIEIHDEGVVVRLLTAAPPLDLDLTGRRQAFALSDGGDTRYWYVGGGASGYPGGLRIEARYVPAPRTAREASPSLITTNASRFHCRKSVAGQGTAPNTGAASRYAARTR